jgi:hypothetical protein
MSFLDIMEIPGALFAAFAVGTAIVIWFWNAQHKSTDFPLIGTTETDGSYAKAAESFAKDSHAVLSEGLKRVCDISHGQRHPQTRMLKR